MSTHLGDLVKVRSLTRSGAARATRLAAQLTLGEIAAEVGVTATTVNRWERGQRVPRKEAAVRYLAVLEGLLRR